MDVTTIKLRKKTKRALDDIKKERDTYDEIINRLVISSKKKKLKERLTEGYKSLSKDSITMLKDWEVSSSELEW